MIFHKEYHANEGSESESNNDSSSPERQLDKNYIIIMRIWQQDKAPTSFPSSVKSDIREAWEQKRLKMEPQYILQTQVLMNFLPQ